MNIHKISLQISNFINKISNILIQNKIFRFIFFSLNNSINNFKIKNDDTSLNFFCPNYLIKYRIDTLLTKEPETISWINSFNQEDIFYDVGSNIGLYSCYAAKQKKIKTYSFEPSVFNLEVLVKNININLLNELITVIPISLYKNNAVSEFNLSNIENGGALSSFSEKFTHDGNNMDISFFYKTLGITLDKCIDLFRLPQPDHIKIDVDGIEHMILMGAKKTIKNTKSILIEINENFLDQSKNVEEILVENDFKLKTKARTSLTKDFEKSFNQIWVKKI
jgi:FkbM family methyltransferase